MTSSRPSSNRTVPNRREKEAWGLIANGYTRESAARQMLISQKTLNNYLSGLTRKLGLVGCGGLPSQLTRLWIEQIETSRSGFG
jgi:DNA-binding CsgD family transcriptional regulator